MPGRSLLDPGRRGLVILGAVFIGVIVGVVGLGALILQPLRAAAGCGTRPRAIVTTAAAVSATTAHS